MSGLRETDEIIYDSNLVANQTIILVGRKAYAGGVILASNFWDLSKKIYWSKYQIKETDLRRKTATFSSPNYFDLTAGQYAVLISSPYHENFGGIILNVDYNEETGMYDYQCQDFSRPYLSKSTFYTGNGTTLYSLLINLITHGNLGFKPTAKELEIYKNVLSGLLPAYVYEQSQYGSTISFNPMTAPVISWVKGKREIDVIQDLVYGTGAYIDIYFDIYGVMHFEPYNVNEWLYTGLQLRNNELTNRKPKFDTTNIITAVRVYSNKLGNENKYVASKDIITLDLYAFFGEFADAMQDPTENADEKTSTANKSATSTTNNSSNTTNGNPYNNKAKKIWINSDNGSDGFKKNIISILKNKGWTVKDGGTCSNCHYSGYNDVTKDYAVYATLYNGFCAGTIQEAYSTKIQNILKSKGVQLVVMWDTSNWTNPQGMKPYRYGDFTGYTAHRAWDDNFSSGDPTIKNVSDWLKKKDAKYCAYPDANGVVEQFLAGGYFKWAKK